MATLRYETKLRLPTWLFGPARDFAIAHKLSFNELVVTALKEKIERDTQAKLAMPVNHKQLTNTGPVTYKIAKESDPSDPLS
jgi:hypothetical protein